MDHNVKEVLKMSDVPFNQQTFENRRITNTFMEQVSLIWGTLSNVLPPLKDVLCKAAEEFNPAYLAMATEVGLARMKRQKVLQTL